MVLLNVDEHDIRTKEGEFRLIHSAGLNGFLPLTWWPTCVTLATEPLMCSSALWARLLLDNGQTNMFKLSSFNPYETKLLPGSTILHSRCPAIYAWERKCVCIYHARPTQNITGNTNRMDSKVTYHTCEFSTRKHYYRKTFYHIDFIQHRLICPANILQNEITMSHFHLLFCVSQWQDCSLTSKFLT